MPNRKRFRLFLTSVSLFGVLLLFFSFLPGHKAIKSLAVDKKTSLSGNTYTILYKNDLILDVSLKRPDKADKNIVLTIAGAFTNTDSDKVDGLFIDKGTVYNKEKVNHGVGGAIRIVNGDCEIFPTRKGKLLNDSLVNLVVVKKGSLFQQIQLIEKGVGAKFKDAKLFQRRAIVKLKGGKTAIIESFEHITLAVFTKDLMELGVVDALYTDMGAWDEGWYRDPLTNKPITIGRLRSQTSRQCNWVVYKLK